MNAVSRKITTFSRASALALGLASALAGGAFAQAAAPAATADGDRAKLVAAIVASGCKVNEENNAQVLAASGLTPAQAEGVIQQMLVDGTAVLDGEVLNLKSEGCN